MIALIFLVFILQKEWLCLNCQTQRAVSGQLGDPVPPTMAAPKKQPPAPGSSSTPAAVDSKPVVEPPPPPAPEAKVVPLTLPEPDALSSCSVSSCSVGEPLPDSQENVEPKEQKEPLADANVSEVKQPELSSSETQDPPLPVEGEAGNQSTITGLDATAAPAEVKAEPQISQGVASPAENLQVQPEPENSADVAEEPRPVLTADAVLQEVPPQLEQTSDSTVLAETESQIAAVEQEEPGPVRDGAGLREGTPPLPPSPPFQGEVAEVVGNVVSRTAEAQQEPKPDSNPANSEECQTSSVSQSLYSDGELREPEEVKDLRDVTEQNSEENKASTEEESVELKTPQRVDEEIKATENGAEDKTVGDKVSQPVKMEAGTENEPSEASEEQLVCNNAASETANEVRADEGKLPEEETTEEKEPNDQKTPEEKVNGAEWSQTPSNETENIRQEETQEKEGSGPALTAAEEIPKDETQKTMRTETETDSMTDADKHQNRNTEESAQMASDVIKAKMSEDAPIQGGSETCSQQTNCNESQKEAGRGEERLERGAQEKVPVKDEEGKEVASLIQESVPETEKSAGGDEGGTASPDCLKEQISNQQETTERRFDDGGVAEAVVSEAEPQILLDVANEQGKESQEENTGREEPEEAEDQPLGKASDGETVAEVTVEFSEEKQRGCD